MYAGTHIRSLNIWGVGCPYLVRTLVRRSRYAALQFDLHLTLGLAIVTLTLQMLTGQPLLVAFVAIFGGYIFFFFRKSIPLVFKINYFWKALFFSHFHHCPIHFINMPLHQTRSLCDHFSDHQTQACFPTTCISTKYDQISHNMTFVYQRLGASLGISTHIYVSPSFLGVSD